MHKETGYVGCGGVWSLHLLGWATYRFAAAPFGD
jgi:hypothetical protein